MNPVLRRFLAFPGEKDPSHLLTGTFTHQPFPVLAGQPQKWEHAPGKVL